MAYEITSHKNARRTLDNQRNLCRLTNPFNTMANDCDTDANDCASNANNERSLSGSALTVVSINIEGFSTDKATLLSELCRKTGCHILCAQETHRDVGQTRPYIPGLTLIAEIPHLKHGSAVFARHDTPITLVSYSSGPMEVITVELPSCTVTSIYKPPGSSFKFQEPQNFNNKAVRIVIGDFNSHSINWGYIDTDECGEAVETWAEAQNLNLIHNPKLPSSFNSGRWKRGYNPDLIFASSSIRQQCIKTVCKPIPRTQHRPLMCSVQVVVQPKLEPFRRRFNFAKANWEQYSALIDAKLHELLPTPQNYDTFVDIIQTTSRQWIPRGCRTRYVPGLSPETADLLQKYETLFNTDPFSSETINLGEELLQILSENRRNKWIDTVTNVDLTHNSKKAWSTIRKLTSDPPAAAEPSPVTANQVSHQLLLNGKPPKKLPKLPKTRPPTKETRAFSVTDVVTGIKSLKNGKAAGVDDITVEQIKHLGPVATSWLVELFKHCVTSSSIPRQWRKSKIIALLKPGKSPT